MVGQRARARRADRRRRATRPSSPRSPSASRPSATTSPRASPRSRACGPGRARRTSVLVEVARRRRWSPRAARARHRRPPGGVVPRPRRPPHPHHRARPRAQRARSPPRSPKRSRGDARSPSSASAPTAGPGSASAARAAILARAHDLRLRAPARAPARRGRPASAGALALADGAAARRARRSARRRRCVLASGDPMLHGIGATLARRLGPERLDVHPHPSAFALACARLGWPAADVELVSAVARPPEVVARVLQPGRRIVAYVTGADGAAHARARAHASAASAPARFVVLEQLGGPRERVTDTTAASCDALAPTRSTRSRSRSATAPLRARARPGLPDDAYDTDGQLTKRHVRAITLAALAPAPGRAAVGRRRRQRLDRRSSGCAPSATARAIAIETRDDRARAGSSATRSRSASPTCEVVRGRAPAALRRPRRARRRSSSAAAITTPGLLDACWDALAPGGRLVANAVTLEGEQAVVAARAQRGGTLTRIDIAHAEPIGGFTGWRAQMPSSSGRRPKPMTVHFIGAGPGAPDLLTLRGAAPHREQPRLPLRRRARPAGDPRPRARRTRGSSTPRTSTLDEIVAESRPPTRAGHDVARLHSGDLSIYSAVAEQMRRLDELGIPWDVTPGVPAFAAAAAALRTRADDPRGRADGDPHALRQARVGDARRARSSPTSPPTARRSSSTSARRRSRRSPRRSLPHYGDDCPAAVVARASWPDELVLRGTLADDRGQVARGRRQAHRDDPRRPARSAARRLPRQPPVLRRPATRR